MGPLVDDGNLLFEQIKEDVLFGFHHIFQVTPLKESHLDDYNEQFCEGKFK
jgi:hypothetical protein